MALPSRTRAPSEPPVDCPGPVPGGTRRSDARSNDPRRGLDPPRRLTCDARETRDCRKRCCRPPAPPLSSLWAEEALALGFVVSCFWYSLVCAPPEEPEEAAGDVMAAAAGEASGGGVPSGQRWEAEEGRPSSAPPRPQKAQDVAVPRVRQPTERPATGDLKRDSVAGFDRDDVRAGAEQTIPIVERDVGGLGRGPADEGTRRDPERRRGPWPGGSRGSSDDLAGAGTRLELRATAGRDRATSYDKVTRPGLRRARASGSIAGGGRRAETAKSTQVAEVPRVRRGRPRAPQPVPGSRSSSPG
ncbi:hypothetical protein THAOC_01527 [Thalassiosira oceanica]|uniref:Uncharacterized protein n=1 Tax=Thalassiosira oceanica TaxID=159749 RepID=K0TDH3_THAOC|nr:hypothetical protein THAOC_01527 [Thalassiosira oceanica]|eukprot:EJK76698.1 hypothetical protein THAOC_01527 [Thalassiosira oceanica]